MSQDVTHTDTRRMRDRAARVAEKRVVRALRQENTTRGHMKPNKRWFQISAGIMMHLSATALRRAGIIFLALSCTLIAQSGARRCRITSLVGTVKIRRGGSERWIDGRPNMPLREKDAVRTFVESQAIIETSEGSRIELAENATFEVTIFSQNVEGAQTTKTKILSGSVMTNIKKLMHKNSSFEFETPTATAAIRGTTVGFDVTGDQTSIKVYEGKVLVTPKGASKGAELQSNQMTTVRKGEKEIAVVQMTEEQNKDSTALDSATGDSTALDTATTDTVRADSVTADAVSDTAGMPIDTVEKPKPDTAAAAPADSLDAEQTDSRTGAVDSVDEGNRVTVSVQVTAPAEGEVIRPGGQLAVAGRVSPPEAAVTVAGKKVSPSGAGEFRRTLSAPVREGEFAVDIEASFAGQTARVTRMALVEAESAPLVLTLHSPVEGAKIDKPLIRIGGRTTPGAQVRVSGMTIPVNGDGSFFREAPIPDETGEITIEVEAELDGVHKSLVRTVRYEPSALSLAVETPAREQLFCDRLIPVRGSVRPAAAEVIVNGKAASGKGSGRFSAAVYLPEETGEHEIEIEAFLGDRRTIERRSVVYEPARERRCNTQPPELVGSGLPFSTTQPRIRLSVIDRTPFDEVTIYKSVDGAVITETVPAKAQFFLDLEEGNHVYEVYAEDLAQNRSATLRGSVKYLAKPLMIRMRKPAARDVVRIPPGTPDGGFQPYYSIRFSVENVPDDDPSLIREVIVSNTNSAVDDDRETVIRDPLDIDFDVDVGLARGTNEIRVIVRDVNNQVLRRTVTIEVR